MQAADKRPAARLARRSFSEGGRVFVEKAVGYFGNRCKWKADCAGARVCDPQQATSSQCPRINRDRQIFRALLRVTDPRAVKAAHCPHACHLDTIARKPHFLASEILKTTR